MVRSKQSNNRFLIQLAMVMAVAIASTGVALPQNRGRLSASILGDIGAAVGAAVEAVQSLFGSTGTPATRIDDAPSADRPDDVPPLPKYLLMLMADEAGWTCAACDSGASVADGDDGFSGGGIDLPCTTEGAVCSGDGVDSRGRRLRCTGNYCVVDNGSPAGTERRGTLGDFCGDDRPCDDDWECNREFRCVHRVP